jgi:predicted small secreted protein
MHRILAPAVLVVLSMLIAGCGKPGGAGSADIGSGPPASRSTADTVSTIQQKLNSDRELAGANIRVSQTGGSIALDGTVPNQARKDRAEKVVMDAQKELKQQPGVLDNLMVGGGGSGGASRAGSGG